MNAVTHTTRTASNGYIGHIFTGKGAKQAATVKAAQLGMPTPTRNADGSYVVIDTQPHIARNFAGSKSWDVWAE